MTEYGRKIVLGFAHTTTTKASRKLQGYNAYRADVNVQEKCYAIPYNEVGDVGYLDGTLVQTILPHNCLL